jgi:hypothetical protein
MKITVRELGIGVSANAIRHVAALGNSMNVDDFDYRRASLEE